MVTNRIVRFSVLLIVFACLYSCKIDSKNNEIASSTSSIKQEKITAHNNELNNYEINKMLKAFYTDYINAIENIGESEVTHIKEKYLTNDLVLKIESANLDYDPIVDAQDVDINWLKSLRIIKELEYYRVCYKGYSNDVCIELKVKKTSLGYKIYDINF